MESWALSPSAESDAGLKDAELNWGAVSTRDTVAFGAASPGSATVWRPAAQGAGGGLPRVPQAEVDAWVDKACRRNGIGCVVLLLTDAELARFETSFVEALRRSGLEVATVPSLHAATALGVIVGALREAERKEQRALITCPSGQVRTGTVGALWVHHRHCVSLAQAVEEVTAAGPLRRPSFSALVDLLSPKLADALVSSGRPRRPSSSRDSGRPSARSEHESSATAWGTPRSAATLGALSARSAGPGPETQHGRTQVLFVTTGGTIDKDYPRLTGGYAFEIGEPAVAGILHSLGEIGGVGFTYKIVSVCRKDSQDIGEPDRAAIVRELRRNKVDRVLITHGTDTIVETGEFILSELGADMPQRVVLTGAMRPDKFAVSDARFNVGCALGALWASERGGVFIAMNGNILDVSRGVLRHAASGRFVAASATPNDE